MGPPHKPLIGNASTNSLPATNANANSNASAASLPIAPNTSIAPIVDSTPSHSVHPSIMNATLQPSSLQPSPLQELLAAPHFDAVAKSSVFGPALAFPLLRSHFASLPWELTGRKASVDQTKVQQEEAALSQDGKETPEPDLDEAAKGAKSGQKDKDKPKKIVKPAGDRKEKSPVSTPVAKGDDRKGKIAGQTKTQADDLHNLDEGKPETEPIASPPPPPPPDLYDDQQMQVLQELSKKLAEYDTMLQSMSESWSRAESIDVQKRALPEFSRTGLPIGPSHFSIDPTLQQKQRLIDVERLLPLTVEPNEKIRSRAPSYLMQTASSMNRTPRSHLDTARKASQTGNSARSNTSTIKPFVQSIDMDHINEALAKGSTMDAVDESTLKKKPKHAWMESMTNQQREAEKSILKKMIFRSDYLKNPRFESEKSRTLKPGQEMEPFPSVIQFTDYMPYQVYEIPLSLRNISSVSRRVRVLPPRTPYFSVTLAKYPSEDGLIAPGMKCHYMIRFAPDSLADQEDELTVITENFRFTIPILAYRPPPHLVLPTIFDCGAALVGSVKIVQFSCTNTGGPGNFKLFPDIINLEEADDTQNQNSNELVLAPFTISPTSFYLETNNTITIQVKFSPETPFVFGIRFQIACDNCQSRIFSLTGHGCIPSVELYDIEGIAPSKNELQNSIIHFGDHAPGSLNTKNMRVKNVTGVDLPFHWDIFQVPFVRQDLSFLPGVLPPPPPLPEELVKSEDNVFFVSPVKGIIKANSMLDIRVDYKPNSIGMFDHVAKLMVDNVPALSTNTKKGTKQHADPPGAISQSFPGLQIKLDGKGISNEVFATPCLVSFPGVLLVGQNYTKTFTLHNTSDAEVNYSWKLVNDDETEPVGIHPKEGVISAGSSQDIEVMISPRVISCIRCDAICTIGHGPILRVPIDADVGGPKVLVHQPSVDFGLLMCGRSNTVKVTLENLSEIPAHFTAAIMNPSDTIETTAPFLLQDNEGILEPFSTREISITFAPNQEFSWREILEIIVDDDAPKYLLVEGTAEYPRISLSDCVFDFGVMYIGQELHKTVVMRNETRLTCNFKWHFYDLRQRYLYYEDDILHVAPMQGTLGPKEVMALSIRFSSSAIGDVRRFLFGTMEGMLDPIGISIQSVVHGLRVSFKLPSQPIQSSTTPLLENLSASNTESLDREPVLPSPDSKIAAALEEHTTEEKITRHPTADNQVESLPEQESEQKPSIDVPEHEALEKDGSTSLISDELSTEIPIVDFGDDLLVFSTKAQSFIIRNHSSVGITFHLEMEYYSQPPTISQSESQQTPKFWALQSPQSKKLSGAPDRKTISYEELMVPTPFSTNQNGVAFSFSHPEGFIDSHSELEISLTCFADIYGSYSDHIVCHIKDYPTTRIPVKLTVVGSPVYVLSNTLGLRGSLDPPELQFGSTLAQGDKVLRQLKVVNRGLTTMKIKWGIGQEQTGLPHPQDQSLRFHPFSISPLESVIPPSSIVSFGLSFSSEEEGLHTSILHGDVTLEDGQRSHPAERFIKSSAEPCLDLLLRGTAAKAGLKVNEAEEDVIFAGSFTPNLKIDRNIVISNQLSAPQAFTCKIEAPFSISKMVRLSETTSHVAKMDGNATDSLKNVLNPRESMRVQITFTAPPSIPTSNTTVEGREAYKADGNLVITFQNGATQTYPLRAKLSFPYLIVSPTKWTFGTIHVDCSSQTTIALSNQGNAEARWSLVSVENCVGDTPERPIFSFSQNTGSLPPYVGIRQKPSSVQISFQPTRVAKYRATFKVVVSNALENKETLLVLEGEGSRDEVTDRVVESTKWG
eukprot:TRINITY_DN6423_c0_g1_i2.p1 TRINITY_DN6423_c0_g1~~TRINITY_DN6423_c0_g1_i2.p1  ORF type:complete len:1804 (-),score=364.41 TRINITY_DN6423_c0_g1_i2:48-5459(-)